MNFLEWDSTSLHDAMILKRSPFLHEERSGRRTFEWFRRTINPAEPSLIDSKEILNQAEQRQIQLIAALGRNPSLSVNRHGSISS
jgi:hypothetical protein